MSEEIDVVGTIVNNVVNGVMQNMPDAMLPDPDLLNFYRLNNERIIWLDVEVDVSMIAYERMILLWNIEDRGKPVNERKPIRLMIFNYGGDADVAYSMIDVIKASKTPVYTYNMGVSASAAGLILMAGEKRYSLPNATVLIHQGSATMEGDTGKVLDAANEIKKTMKKMQDYIISRTYIPPALLRKKKANDWTLTAEEALKYGVVHEIITDLEEALK